MTYEVISGIEGHMEMQSDITVPLWPEFMLHDPVSNKYWRRLYEDFDDFQISLRENGRIIAVANSVPLRWDGAVSGLPDRGWDWALEEAFAGLSAGASPNLLCGIQIAVAADMRGKGISYKVLEALKRLAYAGGFDGLVIPVRPSMKSRYPLEDIGDYVRRLNEEGMPFDPWLRVHVRAGGEIAGICRHAMYIPGTISEWEEWTGMAFTHSGEYIVEGALNPVNVSMELDLAEYTEPNVWVWHAPGMPMS